MQTQQPQSPTYDDEISLLELWETLVKRKWIIVACFLLCLIAGAAFALLKPAVYEATATIRIGQITFGAETTAPLLESPAELSTRISSQHRGNGVQASTPRGATTTISLLAQAPSAEDATRSLGIVIENIKNAHQELYERSLQPIRSRLERFDLQSQQLQQQAADLTDLIDRLKEQNPVQASLLIMERNQTMQSITLQDAERLRLLQQLSPPQTRPTELIGEIVAPLKPAQPKRALILVLSGVLGLMGGVMLAFIAEFVSKAKANSARS